MGARNPGDHIRSEPPLWIGSRIDSDRHGVILLNKERGDGRGPEIDCQAGNFAGQSDSTLRIGVTGLTAGTWTYTVVLASAEAELDPADNSIQGSVTVESPSGGGGGDSGGKQDSGGGGLSWLFLLLLGWRAHNASRR